MTGVSASWLLALALLAAILAAGVVAGRRRAQGFESWVLAGRGLPLWLGVLTMTATWVGGGYVSGTAEAAYASGLLWAQAPWGYALSLLVGGLVFAAPMRRRGYVTFLDPFEERLGARTAAALFVPALVGELFWGAAILAALGAMASAVLDVPFAQAVILSAAVAITYTWVGGLWAVAVTDGLQLALIAGGLLLALPFVLDAAGGVVALWPAYEARFAAAAWPWPALSGPGALGDRFWSWLDFALLLVFGGIPWGVYFQRVLSAPSPNAARWLSLGAAGLCLCMALPPLLLGMAGAVLDWGPGAAPRGAAVLPELLRHWTPAWVAPLGLAAVAAAVMSSVDSSVLSISTLFARNVYRPLLAPAASDAALKRVVRAGIPVVGVLATGLALAAGSVYALWAFCADVVYVVLFPQLVAVFLRGTRPAGAWAGMAVGVFLRVGGGEPLFGLEPFLPYPMHDPELGVLFPFRTTSMLASLATILLVSAWSRRRSRGSP